MSEENFGREREKMIERQIIYRGIDDERIISSFRQVPRHEFVPPGNEKKAYSDRPLPIGEEQTISQPYIVAYMLDKLGLTESDSVLEVGSGCGYVLALLDHLCDSVYGIERKSSLVEMSRENLEKLGYDGIEVKHGDGSRGWPEKAPFDGIIVSAAAAGVPRELKDQLNIPGSMIIPVGEEMFHQQLILIKKKGEEDYLRQRLEPVRFVPLLEGTE